MWIYKITNIQNNKVYIGQTIRPIEQRFHRHLNDAINNILDTLGFLNIIMNKVYRLSPMNVRE